jgi:hypothetical protein
MFGDSGVAFATRDDDSGAGVRRGAAEHGIASRAGGPAGAPIIRVLIVFSPVVGIVTPWCAESCGASAIRETPTADARHAQKRSERLAGAI